ncbi:MAG TPA: DUF6776 family protein [Candidatus Binatia bacterium]|nr:DUF6776 family protein [Candidatus Binatia bacterium]
MLKLVFSSTPALCLFVLAGCATTQGPAASGDCQRVAEDNRQLRATLAQAQRALEKDQATFREMDGALKTSAGQIVLLREDLALYRNIIAPPDGKTGLRIQRFDIQPAGASNVHNYKLTLVQSITHTTSIRGTATFQVVGLYNGRDGLVRFPAGNEPPKQVSLKYFQEIGGKFTLPHDFKPRSVRVTVVSSDGTRTVERDFEWPAT